MKRTGQEGSGDGLLYDWKKFKVSTAEEEFVFNGTEEDLKIL